MGLGRLEDNATLHSLRAIDQGQYSVLAGVGGENHLFIIQLFPWTIPSFNGILVHAAAQAARQASIPVAVHLDHSQDEDMVKQTCLLPFDSIMIDMSHQFKEENLAKTKELVAYFLARGKATEAELGRIEGGEDGILDTLNLAGFMTTAEEAQQFVDAGVDLLAPTFGNVHGDYGP
ncbi:fructose-bisphosphate aldolase, class II [Trichoderma asperellum]